MTVVRRMTQALRHRGPDDEGFAWFGGALGSAPDEAREVGAAGPLAAGLGHRRLRVIDLEGGRQPMRNEDGSVAISFNGEIYNYRELRRELEGRGHRFRSRSDTETVAHLYEEMGEECLGRLNGMFAFCLYDATRARLFCARDRMGEKPLYYAVLGGQLAVASELKALARHPDFSRRLDGEALCAYLALEYVPAPLSIFAAARKLAAGHYFSVDLANPPAGSGDIAQRSYWTAPFAPRERPEGEIAAELAERLRRSVESRLASDVPLGVFLSGGIDSSAVVAMMAQLREARSIRTFTIRFEERSFDESEYARQVADFFGTEHREEAMSARRALEILPEAAELLDEPFGDPSILPMHLLCGFTRRHVTVALGGDGGDELFAGYDPFQADAAGRWAARLPGWARAALRAAAGRLPTSHRNISLDFRIKRFLRGLEYPQGRRHAVWLGSFPPEWQRELLSPEALGSVDPEAAFAAVDGHWAASERLDGLDRVIYQYYKLYLQDDILTKVDRASMAHGLEARSPMLDHEFVEWAGTVPARWKLRGLRKKHILKRAMRGILPETIIERRKKGFGLPIAEWFRGPLRSHLLDRLGERSLERMGLLRAEPVRRLIEDHMAMRVDYRKELWTLLSLVEWHRRWGE